MSNTIGKKQIIGIVIIMVALMSLMIIVKDVEIEWDNRMNNTENIKSSGEFLSELGAENRNNMTLIIQNNYPSGGGSGGGP